jgi:hypothetical protein
MSWLSENIIDLGGSKKAKDAPKPNPKQALKDDHTETVFVDSSGGDVSYDKPPKDSFSATDLQGFRKHFSDLLTQNNIPGNDYYEFIAVKNHLTSLPVEEQRYKAAYEGLAAAGLTIDILTQSATKYSNLIDRELSDFQSAYGQQFKAQVTDVKASIADKLKQMADLNAQIAKLNQDINDSTNKVDIAESSLNAKNNSFIKAGQEAKDTIATELSKINQYLKP